MDIDEILSGLQKVADEIEAEKAKLIRLKEKANDMLEKADMWFREHEHLLPEADDTEERK